MVIQTGNNDNVPLNQTL